MDFKLQQLEGDIRTSGESPSRKSCEIKLLFVFIGLRPDF